jgi:hypothetical protein
MLRIALAIVSAFADLHEHIATQAFRSAKSIRLKLLAKSV